MRSWCAIAVLSLALATPAAACEPVDAAERPRIERATDGRGVRISYRATLLAPLAAIDRLLGDPSRFSEWLPGIGRATATADGFVAVYQLPWPLGRVEQVIRVERLDHSDGVSFAWHRVSGAFPRDDSCWRLRALNATTTEVSYSAVLQLNKWVPVYLLRRAQRRALPRAATALERCARRASLN